MAATFGEEERRAASEGDATRSARDEPQHATGGGATAALALLAVLAILVAVAAPLAWLAVRSLAPDDVLTLDAWRAALDGGTRDRFVFSLGQAAAAAAIGVGAGVPASWFLARRGLPFRRVLTALLIAPVAIPGVVYALGLRALDGGRLEALPLVLATHAAFALGVTVWLVTPAWPADARLIEGARLLGASRWRTFLAVTWPSARRALRLAAALSFLHAYAAFATVLVLGGASERTLEVVLSDAAAGTAGGDAAALALVQAAVAGLALLAGGVRWRPSAAALPATPIEVRAAGLLYLVPLAALVLAAPVAVVRGALLEDRRFSTDALGALLNLQVAGFEVDRLLLWSAAFAAGTGLLATLAAWPAARILDTGAPRRAGAAVVLGALFVLPLALTPVAIALGARGVAAAAGIEVDATWGVLLAVHAVIAYPFALRVLTSVRRTAAAARLVDASLLLGESPRRAAWRWHGRRAVRAFLAAVLVAGVVSASEVAAAALLAPASVTPASVGLFAALDASSASATAAYALASVLMLAAVVAFLLAEWLRRGAARLEAA